MALVLRSIFNVYHHYFEETKDPRQEGYPLLGSPIPVLMIVSGYLYFAKSLGPRLMADRKPFDLKNVMTVYNLLQVAANAYVVFSLSYNVPSYQSFLTLNCVPVDYSDTPLGHVYLRHAWYYYMLKVIDLLDTVFFVLRKNFGHISFLHIYHHSGMVIAAYLGAKFVPGGHSTILGIINCTIHSFMYGYYFLTVFKPEMKKSFWWKKHITHLQLIQFAILLVHYIKPILSSVPCEYPLGWIFVGAVQNFFMLLLFGDFYIKAYLSKRKEKTA